MPEKGLDLLVDAAIAIAGSVDFRVEIWGFQPGRHVDLAEALKGKIRQAGLEDRFHLLLKTDAKLKARLPAIEKSVADGSLSPALAVDEIVAALGV